ncbi:MAG: TIGR03086 family metal-binding protein, partial [Candidatus Dormiibacterota bacterium]
MRRHRARWGRVAAPRSWPRRGSNRAPHRPAAQSVLAVTKTNTGTTPDRRGTLIDAYENAAMIVAGISREQLHNSTPCPGYDVAGLIDHVVEAGCRAAALGRGQAPPSGDASPHVELTDAPVRLRSAAQEAAVAWADDTRLVTTATMPWGEQYTGAALIDMYLLELAVHAWDLARATGQLDQLASTLAAPALSGAHAFIKPEFRNMVGPGA